MPTDLVHVLITVCTLHNGCFYFRPLDGMPVCQTMIINEKEFDKDPEAILSVDCNVPKPKEDDRGMMPHGMPGSK